ncbi:MAG: DNA replication and repair protein RecF [Candidatus Doudnabacteria bacterium]|nr:DNA replication and repair protein RecF [Candidatus Doudnabacteria bacterium]
MFVSRVSYENFRNFPSLDLTLDQGFVILTGENGAGKTNFLEGIYFGAGLRRFPESKLPQLVREGEVFSKIKISSRNKEEQNQELVVERKAQEEGGILKLKINSQPALRISYTAILPVISFLPQDLSLLTRSPGGRRRFLNETLSSSFPEYRLAQTHYQKALKQRNELLAKIRNGDALREELEIWDEKLAETGSTITKFREEFFSYCNQHLAEIMEEVSADLLSSKLGFSPGGNSDRNEFLKLLRSSQVQDLRLANTMVGPHRDDFSVFLGRKEAVGYLSRGQMRSLTLALKILERNYFEKHRKTIPIMLFDDVFSEFDSHHQRRLASFLANFKQPFLTTTHPEEIKAFLPEIAQIFNVDKGKVSSV